MTGDYCTEVEEEDDEDDDEDEEDDDEEEEDVEDYSTLDLAEEKQAEGK